MAALIEEKFERAYLDILLIETPAMMLFGGFSAAWADAPIFGALTVSGAYLVKRLTETCRLRNKADAEFNQIVRAGNLKAFGHLWYPEEYQQASQQVVGRQMVEQAPLFQPGNPIGPAATPDRQSAPPIRSNIVRLDDFRRT